MYIMLQKHQRQAGHQPFDPRNLLAMSKPTALPVSIYTQTLILEAPDVNVESIVILSNFAGGVKAETTGIEIASTVLSACHE